jgi:cell division protein FtsB
LRHDPEYIGIIARDKLDLMKDGEVIYRIDPTLPDASKLKLRK